MSGARDVLIPGATYRVQPEGATRQRSRYDVVDPRILNPEIGTDDDLGRLHEALATRGMGLSDPGRVAGPMGSPFEARRRRVGEADRFGRLLG
jgi:hypothetical protein